MLGVERRSLIWAGILMSCQPDPQDPRTEPFEIQWEGEEIRFAAAEDAGEVCGGTRAFLDRSVAVLEEVAGEVPRFSFFVVPSDDVDSLCRREDVGGCAAREVAYAVDAALVHEVVHVVRHLSEGFPSPGVAVFEEGLADLYSAHSNVNPPAKPPDIAAFFDRDVDDAGGPYGRTIASYYLSSLATAYGDEAVWDFVTATGELRDGALLRDVFERHFPESFDAFNQRFSEEPMCSGAARSRKLVECGTDGPDVRPEFGDIILSATETGFIDCADEGVVGPRAGEMWTTKTFDVLEDTVVYLSVSFTDDPWEEAEDGENPDASVDDYVEIMPCGAGCTAIDGRLPEGFASPGRVELAPGRYVVRFGRPVDDPGFATLYLSSDPEFPFYP